MTDTATETEGSHAVSVWA